MKPRHYVNVAIAATGGVDSPVAASAVMRIVHGAFRNHPGMFAVAFPQKSTFSMIRIFADNPENLNLLQTEIENHPDIVRFARFKAARVVPSDFAGEWASYTRFRIPSRKADRHEGAPLRLKRLREADDANMPFLMLRSKSQKTDFGLRFKIEKGLPCEDCLPDSYGLSTSSKVFSLPLIDA